MKRSMSVISIVFATILIFNLQNTAQNTAQRPKTNNPSPAFEQLISKLPASDAVIGFDLERLRNSAIPTVLGGETSLLNTANSLIAELKSNYGIDLGSFESAAAGIAIKQIKDNEFDFEPAVIVRGSEDSQRVISDALGREQLNVTTETVADKTMYIVRLKTEKTSSENQESVPVSKKKNYFAGLQREFALAMLDDRTIAIGTTERVRQTLKLPGRIDQQLIALVRKAPGNVLRFAARSPRGISKLLPLDSDDLGQSIESIRFIYGGLTVEQQTTKIEASGITATANAALSLKETLEGVQTLGKALLGNSKGADKALYRRLLESAVFTAKDNEVKFQIGIPHSDVRGLIGMLSK